MEPNKQPASHDIRKLVEAIFNLGANAPTPSNQGDASEEFERQVGQPLWARPILLTH